MGEYARYKGQEIKIGTCSSMYYLRWDDRAKVQGVRGNVNPAKNPEGLRFRVPWPDEDTIGPGGDYEAFRVLELPGLELNDELSTGSFQLHHKDSGLLLNVDCHHGRQLPEAGPGVRAHWNGKRTQWLAMPAAGVKCDDSSRLLPIVACAVCGEMWRLDDWAPVLNAVADPVLRDRLAAYAAN